jgi:hypothetical protein
LAKPAILADFSLFLITDHPGAPVPAYTNNFRYSVIPPDGFAVGDDTEDLVVSVSVDSEFGRENRRLNDIEAERFGFRVRREAVSPLPLPAFPVGPPAYADFAGMTDTHPGGTLQGVWLPLRNLNIPLRQQSRVRFSVIIPSYNNVEIGSSGWFAYGTAQALSSSFTLLEELES